MILKNNMGCVGKSGLFIKNTFSVSENLRKDHQHYFCRNTLSKLRQKLLMQEQAKLSLDENTFSIKSQKPESNKLKKNMDYSSNTCKSMGWTQQSLITAKYDSTRNNVQQNFLPPIIQGKQLIETFSATQKNSGKPSLPLTDRMDMNETIRINLSRLPPQVKPSIPPVKRKVGKEKELALQTFAMKGERKQYNKQIGPVSKNYRLRPLLSEKQISHFPNVHSTFRFKFDPLVEGDRIDESFFNDYFSLSRKNDTPRTCNRTEKHAVDDKNKSIKSPSRCASTKRTESIPKMVYKSDSSLSFSRPLFKSNNFYKTNVRETIQSFTDDEDGDIEDNDREDDECSREKDEAKQTLRRYIVVDMPHIVLNTPSPDIDYDSEKTFVGFLSKTLAESELRQREIKHLLDDVKELNKQSEASATPE